LQKHSGAQIGLIVLSGLVLAAGLGIRYGWLESGFLPLDCGGSVAEGLSAWCGVKWLVVQSFLHQRLGWISLACGVAAFVSRRRGLGWIGWLTGLAGLVLYNFELAAVGAMLSLLLLVRGAAQGRRGEDKPGQQPGDGLGIGGLA
jgi:hypothetical protein